MPKGMRHAIICLRISSILYILISLPFGILPFFIFSDSEDPVQKGIIGSAFLFGFVCCIGIAVFVEIVIRDLKKKQVLGLDRRFDHFGNLHTQSLHCLRNHRAQRAFGPGSQGVVPAEP